MSFLPLVSTTTFTLAGAILMLALPQTGMSQVTPFNEISDDDIDVLDEIVVYGQLKLRLLRNRIYTAEENFYELFNSLNSGKEYDIRCSHRRIVGSHIKRRYCEANFVNDAHAEASFAGRLGQGGPPAWAVIRHKNRQLRKKMDVLVTEHLELQGALQDFAHAKLDFDVAVQERCTLSFGVCRN